MPFCWIRAFLFYKGKGKEDEVEGGVRVNGQVNRYVIISPARRDFLFFGVEVSLGGDSSLRRFIFGRGKCSVDPPA